MFYNKSGGITFSGWSLLTSTSWRIDDSDANISLITLFDKYIENGVLIEYQNTAGNVFMHPVWISKPYLQFPSIIMQTLVSNMVSGPIDAYLSYVEG